MKPSAVLALYYVGLSCACIAFSNILGAIGASITERCLSGLVLGFLSACWFMPRFRAYERTWRP